MTLTPPLRVVAAVALWAVHFAALYGSTALACARGRADVVPTLVVATTIAGVALACAIFVGSYPHRARFAHWLAAAVALLVVLAMAWETLAALIAPACR
jgi:hypothetical protein